MPDFALVDRLKQKEHRDKFYFLYDTMENYIKNRSSKNPEMTNHEILHIKNVMENANSLVDHNYFQLSESDIFYLCLSICAHDLAMGNYYNDRVDHHKKIHEVFDAILEQNEGLDTRLLDSDKDIICMIAEAHSGDPSEAYNKLIDEERFRNINKLNIAMLLRISDELDITQKRLEGYTLSTFISNYGEEAKLHWIKHKSIVNWEILQIDKSYVTLYLKSDILDKFIPKYCPDITRGAYLDFMKKSLLKLKNELEVVNSVCNRLGGSSWNLKNLNLKPNYEISTKNSDYISEINECLLNEKYINKEREPERSIDDTDSTIRNERKQKDITSFLETKKGDYIIIGDDKYRESLDKYIKKESMLSPGCYKHRNLKVLSWLDSFGFHRNNSLLHESSNVITEHIKNQDIDVIIGLGLKGSRIATVVGVKADKPVTFFVGDKIFNNVAAKRNCKIAMITDCIITGATAISCRDKLRENKINVEITGVYSVFIRNHADGDNQYNQLMKEKIKIYSINDTYTYKLCPYERQEDCPLYLAYGNENYKRSYKRRK